MYCEVLFLNPHMNNWHWLVYGIKLSWILKTFVIYKLGNGSTIEIQVILNYKLEYNLNWKIGNVVYGLMANVLKLKCESRIEMWIEIGKTLWMNMWYLD